MVSCSVQVNFFCPAVLVYVSFACFKISILLILLETWCWTVKTEIIVQASQLLDTSDFFIRILFSSILFMLLVLTLISTPTHISNMLVSNAS